jgi:hypothetical protein
MTPEKTREIRLRRALARQGYTLSKSRRRDPRALDYGLYIISTKDGEDVFDADDLDDIEKWATAGDATRGAAPAKHAATVTAEQYSEICDAVERTFHGWPLTDDTGMLHTSREARATAVRIIEILGMEIQS